MSIKSGFYGLSEDQIEAVELADRLGRLVPGASRQALSEAARDHYLPEPDRQGLGPGVGVRSVWPAWVADRAKYLFRLRAIGMRGDQLRFFLFLRDGWGWRYVHSICVSGFRKLIAWNRAPVKKRLRKPTPAGVNFEIEEIAAEQDIKHPDLARFIHGMGWFGKPLEQTSPRALSPLLPLADVPENRADDISALIIAAFSMLGLSWDQAMKAVESADEQTAELARILFLDELRSKRRWSHSKRTEPFRESRASTNLLTFGQRRGDIAKEIAKMPGRFTLPQCLGAIFSMFIFLVPLNQGLDLAFDMLRPYLESAGAKDNHD